jgi:hypothetical protein
LDDGWIQLIHHSSRIIHEVVMKGCRRVHRPRALQHGILGETARIVVRTLVSQVVIGGAPPIPALRGRVPVKCASGRVTSTGPHGTELRLQGGHIGAHATHHLVHVAVT